MISKGGAVRAPSSDVRLRFRLMGRFGVWRDGRRLSDREVGSRKGRTLLQVLLVRAGEYVSADHLAEVVWEGAPPEAVARHLAPLVSRLRRVIGPDVIDGGAQGYRLRVAHGVAIDIVEAARLTAEAEARLAAAEPSLAWSAAERALGLLGEQDLLEDVPADWAAASREHVRRLRRRLRGCAWESALAASAGDAARRIAEAALQDDPLDEEAVRALMRAHRQRGDLASALTEYERARVRLADELGVDPSAATRELHTALLRDEEPAPARSAPLAAQPTIAMPRIVGRDAEVGSLERRWSAATAGEPALVLVVGEAGIGKTELAEQALVVARATGGTAVRARCYEAERSLFLGPVVEALASLARELPPKELRAAADTWAGTLAELVPDIGRVLRPLGYEPSTAEVERRRAFEAVTSVLRTLSRDRPLLLFLDDLHNAGSSTLELLHYLCRRAADSRILLVATLRVEESQGVMDDLGDVAERLDLGPLPDDAVVTLARAAGADAVAPRLIELTRGHTLSVVETLRAVREAGDVSGLDAPPVPASLQEAVLARIRRAGAEVEDLLRGGATLGATFDLGVVADLLDLSVEGAAHRAERASRARLLVEDGPRFAFSNDLIREIVERTTPLPTRVARHRRAATLLESNPEAVGLHASAAEDWPRALDAWLAAGDRAAGRYANRDAKRLLDRAAEAAIAAEDPVGQARVHLARGRVREALSDYEGAVADFEAAVTLGRDHARPDLEAAALRWLGGDALIGMGRPSIECLPYLEAGLDVAEASGDATLAVELLDRLAVLWCNRARFDVAAGFASRALVRAHELGDDRALAFALDGMKTTSAYTGELDRLADLLPELDRLQRAQGNLPFLQWAVFESAIRPFAHARWPSAVAALERALAINRRTGHPYNAMFLAQLAWLHRTRGDYGQALASAVEARRLAGEDGHPWWIAFTAVMERWIRTDLGALDQAVICLEEGTAVADRDGMEAYLLRCVSHLALALWHSGRHTEATRTLERAEELLDGVTAPEGTAFLHAAHAYAAAARVRLARREVAAAERLLDVVAGPAEKVGWLEVMVTDRLLRGAARALSSDVAAAQALLGEAAELAERSQMLPLAREARATLARLAELEGNAMTAATETRAAKAHLRIMAATIDDPAVRSRYLEVVGDTDVAALLGASGA